jgi:acyl dehydratase
VTEERAEIVVGDNVPPWGMPDVRPERMRTTAAILRDPNPIHWDPVVTRTRGLDGRVINQGPLNVGYVANMLMAWQGATCIRRLRLRFPGAVFDHEHITARGLVAEIDDEAGTVTCDVWLERPDGSRPVEGTATVRRR